MKKVPYRQQYPYGCGSFALANLFNDANFLTNVPRKGQLTSDLNLLLQRDYSKYSINPVLCMSSKLKKYNRIAVPEIFDIKWQDRPETMEFRLDHCRPLFSAVHGILDHYILLIQSFTEPCLWVVDSLKQDVVYWTYEEFLAYYHVLSIELLEFSDRMPGMIGGPDNVFFTSMDLSHLIG